MATEPTSSFGGHPVKYFFLSLALINGLGNLFCQSVRAGQGQL